MQARSQIGQSLEQAEAVDTQPDALIDGIDLDGQTTALADTTDGCADQLGTKHFFQRPAHTQIVRESMRRRFKMTGERPRFVLNDPQKTIALLRRDVGEF